MTANEKDKRIKLSREMQNIVNVNRLAAIVEMFNSTMLKLDDRCYPEELRQALNEFRYETLDEFQKKIITWMMDNFYCEGE